MNKHILAYGISALIAAAAAGCLGFDHSSSITRPTASGMSALMGSWSSATIAPSPSSCTDFKWNVTEQTSTMARGSFSATCASDLKVNGTAQGMLNGSTIVWSAVGTGSSPSVPSCAITLNGTAELGADSIRVPYQGDVCGVHVSGVEVLKKR